MFFSNVNILVFSFISEVYTNQKRMNILPLIYLMDALGCEESTVGTMELERLCRGFGRPRSPQFFRDRQFLLRDCTLDAESISVTLYQMSNVPWPTENAHLDSTHKFFLYWSWLQKKRQSQFRLILNDWQIHGVERTLSRDFLSPLLHLHYQFPRFPFLIIVKWKFKRNHLKGSLPFLLPYGSD